MKSTPGSEIDLRSSALDVLGLGKNEVPGIPALLSMISAAEFQMSPVQIEAIQILANTAVNPKMIQRTVDESRYAQICGELAQFKELFFLIPPAERKSRWNVLNQRCSQSPNLAFQLNQLRLALDVDVPAASDDVVSTEIVDACTRIFLANPRHAAEHRGKLRAHWAAEPHNYEQKIIRLAAEHRAFFNAVAPWLIEFASRCSQKNQQKSAYDALRNKWAKQANPENKTPQ